MMKAYHGEQSIKDTYLNRVRSHREQEQLVQGFGYWKGGKGCAVGCTIHGSSHAAYETELGIPRAIARIEDGIFEGLPVKEAMAWPERFLEAITPGADLSGVVDGFLHWLLVDPTDGVIRFAKTEKTRTAIQAVGDLYTRKLKGEAVSREEWRKARENADAAAVADAAAYAAAVAYVAAAAADAAAYVAYVADAAAYAAAYAAAVAYVADAAAYAAAVAYVADAADREKARVKQAAKLIELLKTAPMAKGAA
jgi:hypothetical protein